MTNRTESYEASDGRVYSIEFRDVRYVVRIDGEVFTLGSQPVTIPPVLEDWAARQFAIEDIEAKLRDARR